MRTLIVDNNEMMRSLISNFLEISGHAVIAEAESSKEALEAYSKHKPDLITLDLSIIDGDGTDFLKALRLTDKNTKVLVISANCQSTIVEEVMAAGASHFLPKPFAFEEFKKALEHCESHVS